MLPLSTHIEATLYKLKFHLKRAQDRMKSHADKGRTDISYDVGDWVYVKLQPHRQVTMRKGEYSKLSPKYYGPFLVQHKVGSWLINFNYQLLHKYTMCPPLYRTHYSTYHKRHKLIPRHKKFTLVHKQSSITKHTHNKTTNSIAHNLLIYSRKKNIAYIYAKTHNEHNKN